MEKRSIQGPLSTAGILTGLLLCFVLQGFVAFRLGWKTQKTESNYFSSLIRFQAAGGEAPPLTVVGSSITGRLPGRETGNHEVSNLGVDGGSARDGITMLLDGRMHAGAWVIVEVNSIERVVLDPPSSMLKAVGGPVFAAGVKLPVLSYSARPTGMLYGKLLNRQPAAADAAHVFPLALTEPQPTAPFADERERQRMDELVTNINKLKQAGSRVLLVEYPSGPMGEKTRALTDRDTAYVAREAHVPFANLAKQIPRDQLTFSDPVHLNPTSARDVLASLRSLLSTLP